MFPEEVQTTFVPDSRDPPNSKVRCIPQIFLDLIDKPPLPFLVSASAFLSIVAVVRLEDAQPRVALTAQKTTHDPGIVIVVPYDFTCRAANLAATVKCHANVLKAGFLPASSSDSVLGPSC